jgi:hypothetical protein
MVVGAMHGAPPAWDELRRREPVIRPTSPKHPLYRLAATKQLQQWADVRKELAYIEREPAVVALVEVAGARTVVAVPMLKENSGRCAEEERLSRMPRMKCVGFLQHSSFFVHCSL